jgi:hypothetical protein
MVEPRAAEDQLAEPVDERLALDEREPLPVPDEVAAQVTLRVADDPVRRQLDEVGDLLCVELAGRNEAELDGRGDHPLLEIRGVEGEAIAEKLDDVVRA